MMVMNYETTFKIEILNEYGASISSAFSRYAKESNIKNDEKDHPIIKARIEARRLANKLTSCPDEQIPVIEKRLHELKSYLYEVNPNAII